MEKLRGLLDSNSGLDSAVRNIVNTIADHDNIPRKRPKVYKLSFQYNYQEF